jgi:hypothetical protein
MATARPQKGAIDMPTIGVVGGQDVHQILEPFDGRFSGGPATDQSAMARTERPHGREAAFRGRLGRAWGAIRAAPRHYCGRRYCCS